MTVETVRPYVDTYMRRWRRRMKRLQTPAGAFSQCHTISGDFGAFCAWSGGDRGVLPARRAQSISGVGYIGAYELIQNCDPRWSQLGARAFWIHSVTNVGGVIVDFTWRQFNPESAFPLVMPYADWRKLWQDVEVRLTYTPYRKEN